MKVSNVMTNVGRSFKKTGFKVKKNAPVICLVTGAIGVVVGTIMVGKASTHLEETIDESKKKIDEAKKIDAENGGKKELTKAYISSGASFVKLYGPAVAVEAVSLGSIFAGHHILSKRNVALGAAYASLNTTFEQYKKNVEDRFGTDVANELRYGVKEENVVDENGNPTAQTVKAAHISESDYARFFDETNPNYLKEPEYNLMFLKSQQAFANDKLKCQGYLFLNDVYDLLGMEKSKAGQVIGWIYDEANPVGDNYIDFGIYDYSDAKKRAFVNGLEPSILLDFNVDGNIWELMR